jgi:hypothetical protein
LIELKDNAEVPMERSFRYGIGCSKSFTRQHHKSDLEGNRFQSKLFRQQVEVQKNQTMEHQRIRNSKINYAYNSSLTSTQQLILLFTLIGVLIPVAIAHQDVPKPQSTSNKDTETVTNDRKAIAQVDNHKHATSSSKIVKDKQSPSLSFTKPYLELAKKPATNLRELLLQKTYFENDVFKSEEETKKCEDIIDLIFETMETLPSSKGHIERSIRNPKLKFYCITGNSTLLNRNFGGAFIHELNSLFIKTSVIDYGQIIPTLHHEFRHADFYFLHQNEACSVETDERSLPFFPTTPEMIVKFEEALNKGDKRIKKYKALWERLQAGQFLNSSEIMLFDKYLEASKESFAYPYTVYITKLEYKDLLAESGWKENGNKGGRGTVFFPKVEREVKLLKLGESGTKELPYFANVKDLDGTTSVMTLVTDVKKVLNDPLYKNRTLKSLLHEREANTMQGLSLEAMKVFYPEAYNITQEFISTCYKTNLIKEKEYTEHIAQIAPHSNDILS